MKESLLPVVVSCFAALAYAESPQPKGEVRSPGPGVVDARRVAESMTVAARDGWRHWRPNLHAQQDPKVTVVRSLLPFAPPSVQVADLPFSAIPGESVAEVPFALEAAGEADAARWVVALLEGRHQAAIESGRLQLVRGAGADGRARGAVRDGATLVLRGERNAVEACRRDLDALEAAVARPIEVTAWRLPLPEGALPATTWTAAQVQQAMQAAKPEWTATAHTRAGGALRLAQERSVGYLRDFDTEVAEKSKILDPKVDVLFAGTRLSLVVDALPGDDLLLRGGWLHTGVPTMRAVELDEAGSAIDAPEVTTAFATFGGRIGSGGALCVAGRGGDVGPTSFLLVVSARWLAPPAGDAAPDLFVRPVGAWLPRPMPGRPRLGWPRPGDDSPAFAVRRDCGLLGGEELLTLLGVGGSLEGELHVVAGGDGGRSSDAALQELTANLRNLEITTRAVADGTGGPEFVVPALAGWPVAAFVGRESAVLRDHEVEIASRAAEGNPVVGIARSGIAFGVTAVPDRAGFHVHGAWSVAAHESPRRLVHPGPPTMPLQLVDARLTVLPWDASLALDREHGLGDGPPWRSGQAATKVVVKLTAR
ncbi:MAG: hypothetical protein JNK15_04275 [Planctomycetes bacterium]|nr:hypothetical protein [Planctomycetota bacterium]